MIVDAGAKGLIKKDTVIVEPTSGNTDIFRASVCAAGNTSSSTPSLIRRLQSGGNSYLFLTPSLVLTPEALDMLRVVRKASATGSRDPNHFLPQ